MKCIGPKAGDADLCKNCLENLRDSLVLWSVLGSLLVTHVVLCGLGVTSYPQHPDRSQHGCTVGTDRDPPVWHLHPVWWRYQSASSYVS